MLLQVSSTWLFSTSVTLRKTKMENMAELSNEAKADRLSLIDIANEFTDRNNKDKFPCIKDYSKYQPLPQFYYFFCRGYTVLFISILIDTLFTSMSWMRLM